MTITSKIDTANDPVDTSKGDSLQSAGAAAATFEKDKKIQTDSDKDIKKIKIQPDDNANDLKKIKKDGPYGWLLVLVSFLMQFVSDGLCFTFGLFYAEISKEFPEVGKSGAAWIASILVSVFHVVGPIGSILLNKFGPRTVSFLGSSFAAIGFASSYFSRNVVTMYFTIGILGGMGFGLLYLPAMVVVPKYFDKKLAFAMGVCVSGSGTGTLFFEWAIGGILEQFSWRTALLIIGGVIAVVMPLGLVYPAKLKISDQEGSKSTLRSALDLSLLKNFVFLLFAASEMFVAIGFNTPYIYLPEVEQVRYNSSSSSLLSFMGGANVVSRLLLGYLGDKVFINRRYLCTAAVGVAGVATAICPHLTSLAQLRIYSGLYGTCIGAYICLRSVILVDFLGLDSLTDAFGLLLLVEAVGIFIGTPAVGFFYDHFGDYSYGFYFAGLSIFFGAVLLLFMPVAKRMVQRKEEAMTPAHLANDDKKTQKGIANGGFDV